MCSCGEAWSDAKVLWTGIKTPEVKEAGKWPGESASSDKPNHNPICHEKSGTAGDNGRGKLMPSKSSMGTECFDSGMTEAGEMACPGHHS